MQDPTILLGVGATKAGTTWLFDHLARHPDCHLRGIKELHYFDTLEMGTFGRQIGVQQRKLAAASRPALQGDLSDWLAVLKRRIEDVPAYLRYLTRGLGEKRLVADITPAYALLPVDRLRRMADMAADVRFLYLLRDPVARLWSQVRMDAVRAERSAAAVADAARARLDEALSGSGGAWARSDYAGALARLDAAVDPRRLLVMFQEELMTVPGLARLSAFLGISAQAGNFDRRVHAGAQLDLDDTRLARARAALRPQYEAVAGRFPVLPEVWRRNMEEGHG